MAVITELPSLIAVDWEKIKNGAQKAKRNEIDLIS
jgi:hypothetical protein